MLENSNLASQFDEISLKWTQLLLKWSQILLACISVYCAIQLAYSLNPFWSATLVYLGIVSLFVIYFIAFVSKTLTMKKNSGWNFATVVALIFIFSPLLPLSLLSLYELTRKPQKKLFYQARTRYSDKKTPPVQKFLFAIVFLLFAGGSFGFFQYRKESAFFDIAYRKSSYALPPNLSVRELYALGAECNTYGKTQCSLATFIAILKRRPSEKIALANLAMAQSHSGQHQFALVNFKKLVDMNYKTFDLYFHYGNSLKFEKQFQSAILAYKKAIEKNPYVLEAANKIVAIYVEINKPQQALLFLESYEKLNPNSLEQIRKLKKRIQNNFTP